jgi:cytochrome c-type biogenesis protein CcmH
VNFAFYIAAAAMIVFALLLIVTPLLKGSPGKTRSRGVFATALTIVVALPALTMCLYTFLGTPAALDEQPLRSGQAEASSLDQKRQAVQKWLEAAHAYDEEQRASDARNAYQQVLGIDAKNTVAMVGWVEADMTQHAGYAVDAASRRLLEQAIALEPDNQRALWLFGISQFQQKDYAGASATWRHLQRLLGPGSALAQSIAQQIAASDAKAHIKIPVATLLR